MGTIADKLAYSLDAKEGIKQALVDKGVSVEDTVPLGEYGELIAAIQGGGSGSGSGDTDTKILDISDYYDVWTSGTSYNFDSDPTYTCIVPITRGKLYYLVEGSAPSNRLRIVLTNTDPRPLIQAGKAFSVSGIAPVDINGPSAGYTWHYTNSSYDYLSIYYTNTGQSPDFTLYEITLPKQEE